MLGSGQPQQSTGAPNAEGDYRFDLGELIASPNSLYEILGFLGKGTFGQVLKCWRRDSNEVVALKVLKNLPSYARQGQVEVDVLTRLSKVSSEEWNFVHTYESFSHRGHICIAFELLQTNLYDYLQKSCFQPLPLRHIRPIAQQVLCCLQKLREVGLVHADLKPENVMLVDPERQPFRVKVIDFGSATPRSRSNATSYLQSRYYRAPEVILGLPYDEAIDMWSLGCVLGELFLGWPLFPGASEYDQLSFICQTVGAPPEAMLRNVTKASRFFNRDPVHRSWVLKTPQQFEAVTGIASKETRKFIFKSISDLAHGSDLVHQLDCVQFVSLLSAMLTVDPSARITPSHALQHPFITMQHLAMHTSTQSVRDWIQCMQVCCHARTTASFSPTVHTLTLPPSTVIPQPHPPTLTLPPSTVLPQPHPPTLAYHLAPSTLAYLPQAPDYRECHHQCWSEPDTGYVSADSSPAGHVTVDSLEVPMFVMDRLNPATHQLPPTSYLLTPPLPAGLYAPCTSLPQPAYLSLPQPSSLTLECLQPHNPFSRL